ncbi:DUF4270 family protein [Sphingobacterium gobiense]|uniref:DUF4270 domain-containing protein n=1 Tax=Sphingobacterium gobiense TaxID=1382456 RepID=A0A2S9JD78_9SPHI|nr:DUF4270 family protein [Sphingobacterium gobiense]PRD50697.1 hypothetical protein C5749_19310 [Sphingobacterium gobiense]
MNQFLKRSIHFFTISFFTFIIVAACDKDMSVMLDNSATSNVGVTLVDSFTVNTSTVQLTDLPAAGTGVLLVGKATVPQSGIIRSTSYFRVGFSTLTNDIPEAASFDSLSLVIRPTHNPYYFGDTTAIQKIQVHQLTEALATKTAKPRFPNQSLPVYITGATLFSDQTFAYDPTPIGSVSFRPHLHSLDSLNIRLADHIGHDFFNRIKAGDLQMSSNDNFKEYFKGMALIPEESNTAVIAFHDTIEVRVNYSFPGADGHPRTSYKTFSIVERGFQYNNITTDRAGTPFEELSEISELPTSATGGLTFVQAGSGTVAKIAFPSLKEFLQNENIAVNKAELVIETSSRRNTMYPIPSSLMLFIADQDGIPTSFLQNPYGQQGQLQQVPFVSGGEMGQNGTYRFNLLLFLQQLKSSDIYDNTSFYLSATSPSLFDSFNTAVIASENAKPKIKLNILYTKFR